MTALAQPAWITVAEYVAFEDASPIKHEYYNGEVFAMAGGSPAHADIIFNVSVAIGSLLRGKPCRGSSSDQRVKVESSGLFTYPDVLVKCPPERYAPEDPHSLLNPTVIFEVLSPSTATYDRTTKFDHYQTIPELREYVLVSQDRVRVEHFARMESGAWTLIVLLQREDVLHLSSLEVALPVGEFYEGLDVPAGLMALTQTDASRT